MIQNKEWLISPQAPSAFMQALSEINPIVAQTLYNRGVNDPEAVHEFLSDSPPIHNPFDLGGVQEAVTLLRQTILHQDPIIVYGDYDVDGITAAAVLTIALRSMGGNAHPYIPSREDEGYGLNPEAIDSFAVDGTRVLLTTDCGIRSVDEINLARSRGLDVIITDHHHVGAQLPNANVIINPKLSTCTYPFKELAGVGVAFKLAQALLKVNHQAPLRTTIREIADEELLDLVALGTIADMVPLIGENHALVYHGLKLLNSARRPGLHALMEVTNTEPGKLTARDVGYSLSPRLNAAGRIAEAVTALDLILAPDTSVALPLAKELDRLNEERRDMTSQIREDVLSEQINIQTEGVPSLIFAASEHFQSGVVGLAASRLLDEYYRPAVVVSIEEEYSKGSARSIPEFHITEALDSVQDILVRHGGHAAAAGFTVLTPDLPELQARLTALADKALEHKQLHPWLQVDAELPLSEMNWDLHNALDQLRPYGYGNPEPVFVSRRVRVLSARAVGKQGRHLKLYVADSQNGTTWDAIAFRQGHWDGRVPDYVDLAYVLERNEWRGRISLQLNVKDIHYAD